MTILLPLLTVSTSSFKVARGQHALVHAALLREQVLLAGAGERGVSLAGGGGRLPGEGVRATRQHRQHRAVQVERLLGRVQRCSAPDAARVEQRVVRLQAPLRRLVTRAHQRLRDDLRARRLRHPLLPPE
eukprot:4946996-Pyramimonas_sp.AAC.1